MCRLDRFLRHYLPTLRREQIGWKGGFVRVLLTEEPGKTWLSLWEEITEPTMEMAFSKVEWLMAKQSPVGYYQFSWRVKYIHELRYNRNDRRVTVTFAVREETRQEIVWARPEAVEFHLHTDIPPKKGEAG